MSGLACAVDGCEATGVIPSDPATEPPSYVCFEHAGIAVDAPAAGVDDYVLPSFHVDVTNNLAAMLLELAAVQMTDDADVVNGAYEALAENTGLQVDICAGIMLAMSMLATLGAFPREDVLALAETIKEHVADAEWQDTDPPPLADEVSPVLAGLGSDESPDPGTDAAHVCPDCDGTGIYLAATMDDPAWPCQVCDGTGYLPEPTGPSIFDALAELDDQPLDLPDDDPSPVHATPDEGDNSE